MKKKRRLLARLTVALLAVSLLAAGAGLLAAPALGEAHQHRVEFRPRLDTVSEPVLPDRDPAPLPDRGGGVPAFPASAAGKWLVPLLGLLVLGGVVAPLLYLIGREPLWQDFGQRLWQRLAALRLARGGPRAPGRGRFALGPDHRRGDQEPSWERPDQSPMNQADLEGYGTLSAKPISVEGWAAEPARAAGASAENQARTGFVGGLQTGAGVAAQGGPDRSRLSGGPGTQLQIGVGAVAQGAPDRSRLSGGPEIQPQTDARAAAQGGQGRPTLALSRLQQGARGAAQRLQGTTAAVGRHVRTAGQQLQAAGAVVQERAQGGLQAAGRWLGNQGAAARDWVSETWASAKQGVRHFAAGLTSEVATANTFGQSDRLITGPLGRSFPEDSAAYWWGRTAGGVVAAVQGGAEIIAGAGMVAGGVGGAAVGTAVTGGAGGVGGRGVAMKNELAGVISRMRPNWSKAEGLQRKELDKINQQIPHRLPADFVDFLSWSNGGEWLGDGPYFRAWSAQDLFVFNRDYEIWKWTPDLTGFAQDGGRAWVFDYRNRANSEPAVAVVDLGALDYDDVEFFATDLLAFLKCWVSAP